MHNLAPTAHHHNGPSKFTARVKCVRWDGEQDIEEADIAALEPENKPVDTSAKGRGLAQHESLAKVIYRYELPFEGLSEKETEQVQWAAETLTELAASVGYQPHEIAIESRLHYYGAGDDFEPMSFGTADAEFAHYVFDAKFGDEHDYYPQMAVLALMKMQRDGLPRVHAVVAFARSKRVRRYVITKESAELLFFGVLNRQNNPLTKPTPCEYCGWCARKLTCEAINSVVDETLLANRPDWGLRLPTAKISEAGSDPVLIGAMRWAWKAYIEPWGEALDYQAATMAATGTVPLGFRRQDEKGRLAVLDSEKAVAALLEAGVSLEQIHGAAGFSLDALGKAYVASRGGSLEGAKAAVEKLLVGAGAAARGAPTFKLMRKKDAEDEIRSALARPVLSLSLTNATQPN